MDRPWQQPYMYQQQKGTTTFGNRQFENWGDNSAMADNSQQIDTSTDVDTDDKNHIIWDLQNSLSPVYRIVYVRECGGELGQLGPHDETKQKMLDILKRFHSEEEETDDMDDDDDADRDFTKAKRVQRSKDLQHT